jgi:RNA polymerase sigma-70 factor, ECF subfamily
MSNQQREQFQNGAQSMSAEAFRQWHDDYRDRLLNSMTGILRNRDAAEEVTAAALATAFAKKDQFRGEASFSTWVEAIARNEARRCLSRNRTVALESLGAAEPSQWTQREMVADAPDGSEARAKLRKALRKIPAIHRRALLDHFIHGRSVKQIARREGIPLGTVLSRIFTGKRILRRAWEA